MSCLGKIGRFANQMVQYAFLRTYARRHGLIPQAPPWIGNYLFDTRDAPIDSALAEFRDPHDKDPQRMIIPKLSEPLCDVDAWGYFQYHTDYYAPDRDFIRSLFQPAPAIAQRLQPAAERLRQEGETVVAFHVRRGDYGKDYFYLAPNAWYLQWLERYWSELANPVLLIASDEPEIVLPAFKRYQPLTARRLGATLRQAPFYPDFFLLSQADALVFPNSTFSFMAAMLNHRLQAAYRSRLCETLSDPPFEKLDPWSAAMLDTSAHVDRFPHIAGVKRLHRHRPRWQRKLIRWAKKLAPGKAA